MHKSVTHCSLSARRDWLHSPEGGESHASDPTSQRDAWAVNLWILGVPLGVQLRFPLLYGYIWVYYYIVVMVISPISWDMGPLQLRWYSSYSTSKHRVTGHFRYQNRMHLSYGRFMGIVWSYRSCHGQGEHRLFCHKMGWSSIQK